LAMKPGHVFSREYLLEQLWGEDKIVVTRTIDVHIKNLREKLGEFGTLIRNLRGVGYKLEL
ncbi:MAG: winged helix-turn-helix domain-containing protein, partial [Candidatus Marinimicrobia bacterium]|nr:winged helix-turn-helix domain-containing protein [Candidatus Neomarinimicrobiota bacterium]